ncbi:hypothetical protein IFM89_005039 [Coptis chinensis]|uniref:F-box domain-containing protein n=1 Tax=Coptis chinensis TaxID=261450 RepID=A0A835HGI9_9MAGN|nr:hypothetical protein IFM89_005039 [Coptis chinensis]
MSIPHELVIEILSRLPVKSLFRFKCVSKSWSKLVTTDQHFVELHLNQSTKSNNINIVASDPKEKYIEEVYSGDSMNFDNAIQLKLPFSFPFCTKLELVGSCNGILCFMKYFFSSEDMYLWNPTTGDLRIIPNIPTGYSVCVFGFGFHKATKEYKLVSINLDLRFIRVYTLGIGSWRTLDKISYNIIPATSSNVLVSGALRWISRGDHDRYLIVSFDLRDEVIHEISLPNNIYQCDFANAFAELGGLLCLLSCPLNDRVDVWVMKEYGMVNSWTQQFTIKGSTGCGSLKHMRPLGSGKNGDFLLCMNGREVVLCGSVTQTET